MSVHINAPVRTHERRPAIVWAFAVVLVFLGLSAVGGGLAMLSGAAPPDSWLDNIPVVTSWTIPGLVLGLVFGAGSLVTAYGVIRRPSWVWLSGVERLTGQHWSWVAGVLLGVGQVVWIGLELAYLPETSFLQVLYGSTGLILVLLPMLPAVRRSLSRPESHHPYIGR